MAGQSNPTAQEPESSSTKAKESKEAKEAKEEKDGPADFETQYEASNIFRSGTHLQPLWRDLSFDAHYYAASNTDVGYTGLAWTFKLGKLKLFPGFGVLFGTNQFTTAPTFSIRWDYSHAWFITQGVALQGLRKSPVFEESEEGHAPHAANPAITGYVRPVISDGNHVSARWKRLTLGGTWEHIQFREGSEWKSGGRMSFRLFPRFSAVLSVYGPGKAEWRGGLLIEPRKD